MKLLSVVFSICDNGLEPGLRFLNIFVLRLRGAPFESKNSFLRVASAKMCVGGKSMTSMIIANCSDSFSPGNIG